MTVTKLSRTRFLGPGIITGSVDNDAGGITTYSVAGAIYGYGMIWTLIPSLIVLLVVQEMNARMGMVTGKGLSDLIRENAGVRITFFIFIGLLLSNIGNTTTEFAGVAGSMEIFGVTKYISVPVAAFMVWVLVVKGTYQIAERIFLIFSASLLTYVISAIMAKPQWGEIGSAIIKPGIEFNTKSLTMVIALVGTTIAPWMQFYMQSSVIEKGLEMKDYKFTLIDIIIGCVVTVVVAFFIMVACGTTLFPNGIEITEAKDAALSLRPCRWNRWQEDWHRMFLHSDCLLLQFFLQLFCPLQPLSMYVRPLVLKQELTRTGTKPKNSMYSIPGS